MLKKLILIGFLATCSYSGSIGKANYLIESGLFKNYDILKNISDSLTDDEKYKLYETQKVKTFWPFLINAFLIPGAGSAIQKDYIPAISTASSYLIGFGLIAYRSSSIKPGYWDDKYRSLPATEWQTQYQNDRDSYDFQRRFTLISGTALIGGAWIYGLVRPFIFASKYNGKLGDALNFTSKVNVFLLPQKESNGLKLTLTMKM